MSDVADGRTVGRGRRTRILLVAANWQRLPREQTKVKWQLLEDSPPHRGATRALGGVDGAAAEEKRGYNVIISDINGVPGLSAGI